MQLFEFTKPCKQLKKLSNKANINPIFLDQNSFSFSQKESVSKIFGLFLIDIDEIFPSEFTKTLYFDSNLKKKNAAKLKKIYFSTYESNFIDKN